MIVGVPREIKPGEARVALTPPGARALAEAGHRVVVERGAGGGSGIRDDEYAAVGAALAAADEVWQRAELVLKVKEPLPAESARLRPGQILFTYLHLAPAPELARALGDSGAIAIAYETVQRADGSLPLLTPMSEVAGRLAVQEGAFYLGRPHGGRGILLSGVPGVPPGNVVILGAGTAGLNAARTAVGLGADVSILDVNPDRLRHVDDVFRGQAVTLMSNSFNVEQVLRRADHAPRRVPRLTFRVGTSGYNYAEWKGTFYPADLPASKMLAWYVERFATVEINATFYRMPNARTLAAWRDTAPAGFIFVLKAPQRITHVARLRDVDEPLRYFCDTARTLGDKLGPVLFQLPPNFRKAADRLADLLAQIPPGLRVAFEFRHASWFDDEIYALLRPRNAALCIADTEAGATPAVATADWGYARLRAVEYGDDDLGRWIATLRRVGAGWREAFVFFKHEAEAPRLA